jgi:hypothetical protein
MHCWPGVTNPYTICRSFSDIHPFWRNGLQNGDCISLYKKISVLFIQRWNMRLPKSRLLNHSIPPSRKAKCLRITFWSETPLERTYKQYSQQISQKCQSCTPSSDMTENFHPSSNSNYTWHALDQSVTCHSCETYAFTHKPKIQKIEMRKYRWLGKIVKCPNITNVNFLQVDFSTVKLMTYFNFWPQTRMKNLPSILPS